MLKTVVSRSVDLVPLVVKFQSTAGGHDGRKQCVSQMKFPVLPFSFRTVEGTIQYQKVKT